MNAKLYLKLMFSAMLVIFASNASADVTGTIAGLVKDASGASVQDVSVTVTNVGTRAKFTTKSDRQL
jgi:hypothetical protein